MLARVGCRTRVSRQFSSMKTGVSTQVGKTYRHKAGLLYRAEEVVLDATGYESGVQPHRIVVYTQLDPGDYPAGTRWVREEADFLKHFQLIKP